MPVKTIQPQPHCYRCYRSIKDTGGMRILNKKFISGNTKGLISWCCQVCVGHVCSVCDNPSQWPSATDYICNGSGEIRHCMIIPISNLGCVDKKCVNHKKDWSVLFS